MPTKGKPQVGTRLTQELYDEVLQLIDELNSRKFGSPWTVASFVERAVAERVAKIYRGRKQRVPRMPDREEVEGQALFKDKNGFVHILTPDLIEQLDLVERLGNEGRLA